MRGWYQIGFEREITCDLIPASLGCRRLMLIRQRGQFRAFDASCPHRGAHLALGGRVKDNEIVCPFHGYTIRLGCGEGGQLAVHEYPVFIISGMVFVRLSTEYDNGWRRYMEDLSRDHTVINGFEMPVSVPMETVIENAFDRRHFQSVHGVQADQFVVRNSEDGALIVESTFYMPTVGTEHRSFVRTPYRALVVSPGLTAVELRGAIQYTVITGATDAPTGGCVIRLSLAFPKSAWQNGPPSQLCDHLLHHSRRGLEEDRIIWENLDSSMEPKWMAEDHPSLKFLEFCEAHRDSDT
jgi:phenylpropionate dioxygenase-like ring-hydroxylating dioxygenase large terminal subunit